MDTGSRSIGRAQHSTPTVTLYARVAAGLAGKLSRPRPSVHLSLVIYDGYSTTLIDGQPTWTEAGWRNAVLIKTHINTTSLPTSVFTTIPIAPPSGMSPEMFVLLLKTRAASFSSYESKYSFPQGVLGAKMFPGSYNSSSYMAALLRSVMGHVPLLNIPGFQAPGWEAPMPAHFFKGEAIR